eukprot:gene15810-18748_t
MSIEFYENIHHRTFRDSELNRFQAMTPEHTDLLRGLVETEFSRSAKDSSRLEKASCGQRLDLKDTVVQELLDELVEQVLRPFMIDVHGLYVALDSMSAQKCVPGTDQHTTQAQQAPGSFLFHLALSDDDEGTGGPLFVLPKLPQVLADWLEYARLPARSSATSA